jgi:hypothetical protein
LSGKLLSQRCNFGFYAHRSSLMNYPLPTKDFATTEGWGGLFFLLGLSDSWLLVLTTLP